jgi:Tfp pilus assembly protein PilX
MTPERLLRPGAASERGMALISALLLLMVMSGLAIALTASGRIEVAMGDNEELYARTRAASEAGLNHGAAIVLGLTSTPTYPLNNILLGPDGAADTSNMSASANADNGVVSHLISGGSACAADNTLTCWPVAGTEYSYTVRLFEDDDPALKNGANFTNTELTAMGPPPDPAEDGNRFNDINKRIVIRATGYGPRNTQVQLEQMLMPIKMPALLVNGNLEMAGNAQVIGSQGSVHANGNLTITGNAVTITENATASGTLTAGSGWDPGELESGGMPAIPVPDIHAIDYFNDADFVLQANGRITNKDGTTIYCNASANSNACRNITPPGGTAGFGWTFDGSGWDLSQNSANSATYYARTDVRITGNPGSSASPILLTIIAEGDIQISGNPDLRPEPLSELQFVTDQDLWIHGNLGVPLAFEGRILVREQIDFAGNPTLAGQVIVQDVPTVSTLVTNNIVTGSVTLSYNGLIETVAYTVSGWRETQ